MRIVDQKVCLNATRSDLSGSRSDDVNLSGCDFENGNLSGCRIRNADLAGAAIRDSRFDGAAIEGNSVTDLLDYWRAGHGAKDT